MPSTWWKIRCLNSFLNILCADSYLDEDIFGEDDDSDYDDIYDAGKLTISLKNSNVKMTFHVDEND